MLNFIWLGLILLGVFVAGLLGRISGDQSIAESAFASAKAAITLALGLVGGMMLWLGMLRLADKAGLVRAIAWALRPVMRILFPEIPANHPATGAMILNMAANMLGLGNAATPLGLKAMQELDKLNPRPGTATNSMVTFLALNTSAVTLIPATSLIYISAAGIPNPHGILLPTILATVCAASVAVLLARILQGLPGFALGNGASLPASEPAPERGPDSAAESESEERRPIALWRWVLGIITVLLLATVVTFELHPSLRQNFLQTSGLGDLLREQEASAAVAQSLKEKAQAVDASARPEGWRGVMVSASALVIPCLFVIFTAVAAIRGVKIYEEFVQGAKEGWDVAIRIMPFLVAILVAMGIFRDSGALTLLQWLVSPLLNLIGFPAELLPLALMRPLSGSGSAGIMAEILSQPEIPNLIKYTAATMFGSTETTFYVLSVYFGSVSVRRSRHAILAGLGGDLSGIVASVILCRMMLV
ncbi:MAG: Spore maturation protein SpmA /Spore maturation protein SpmB [Verrucomicrobia bacterium]|nr:MAG: Spore maturation protein SpmA /Spore maturation protein SpmB [Verrucomicrobiota bacterium]